MVGVPLGFNQWPVRSKKKRQREKSATEESAYPPTFAVESGAHRRQKSSTDLRRSMPGISVPQTTREHWSHLDALKVYFHS